MTDTNGQVDMNAYRRFLSIVEKGENGKFSGKDYELIVRIVNAYRKLGLYGDSGHYFASAKHGVGPARLAPPTPKVTVRGVEAVLRSFGWECDGIGKAHYVGKPIRAQA